jgi:NADH-quinone oxidoreductase subunit A
MLEGYFPVFVFILIGVAFGIAPVVTGLIVAPHRPDSEKLSPYECGFEAFEDARMKFDVRYYLIAILFILFDLEVAFLLPWATIFKEIVANRFGEVVRLHRDAGFYRHPGRGLCVCLGQGRSGLGVSDGH